MDERETRKAHAATLVAQLEKAELGALMEAVGLVDAQGAWTPEAQEHLHITHLPDMPCAAAPSDPREDVCAVGNVQRAS